MYHSKKITESSKLFTYFWVLTILDLPKLSRRYQPTGQTWLTDWYLCTAPTTLFISWVFLSVPHLFYQIRNHFCDIFLKNQKNLQEMFTRRLRDVTERTSFLRYPPRVLKTSHKRHFFWELLRRLKDVTKKTSLLRCSERSLRYLSQWRSYWDISETSHAGWVFPLIPVICYLKIKFKEVCSYIEYNSICIYQTYCK